MTAVRGERRAIVMVWDGLRPDFVSPELTPNLWRLAAAGVRFTHGHAVFPTVTRVNAASMVTGLLPGRHGIPGNEFFAPGATQNGRLNAGDHTHLEALRAGREGRVLLAPTLAEHVARAGGRTAVVSSGSPGSALLQHPEVRRHGGIMLHPANVIGVNLNDLTERLGPLPPRAVPNTAMNAWCTRVITDVLLADDPPRLIHFWHSDPDGTQHARGIGHPDTLRAIRDADSNLGAMLAALERYGLAGETNVIVASDHGFSTLVAGADVVDALVRAGVKESRESDDVVVFGECIYVRDHDPDRVAAVVACLRRLPSIGPLFTGGDSPLVDGTFALATVGAAGPAAPDVLFSRGWGHEPNEHGYPGTAAAVFSGGRYVASHGAISPWDVHNTLIAAGPDFKQGVVSDVPAGNVDITPTLLHVLGLGVPPGLDGRVLHEALRGGPDPAAVRVGHMKLSTDTDRLRQTLHCSVVDGYRYVDYGTVER
jgi:arylsulfatase A-like enzyme